MELPATGSIRPSDVRARVADAFTRTVGSPTDSSRKWARDYLKDTTALTTLRIITNTDAQKYAVTSSNSWDSKASMPATPPSPHQSSASSPKPPPSSTCGSAPSRGLYDFDETAEYMIIPHIAFGNLSAGAIISRHALSQTSPTAAVPDLRDAEYRVGRYVRDETTGDMLAMEHHSRHSSSSSSGAFPSGRSVGFFMGCGASTTSRQRLYFWCDTQRFRDGDVPACVEWCAASDEVRDCYVCGADPSAACACAYPALVPAHPTHWELAPLAMKVHTGVFTGRARVMNKLMPAAGAAAGAEAVTDPLVSNISIRGFTGMVPYTAGSHKSIAGILMRFAVQISSGDANPARFVMPAPGLMGEDGAARENGWPLNGRRARVGRGGQLAAQTGAALGFTPEMGSAFAHELALFSLDQPAVVSEAGAGLLQQQTLPQQLRIGGVAGSSDLVMTDVAGCGADVGRGSSLSSDAANADVQAWRSWRVAVEEEKRHQQRVLADQEQQRFKEHVQNQQRQSQAELQALYSAAQIPPQQQRSRVSGEWESHLDLQTGLALRSSAVHGHQQHMGSASSSIVDELEVCAPSLTLRPSDGQAQPSGKMSTQSNLPVQPEQQLGGMDGVFGLSESVVNDQSVALQQPEASIPLPLNPQSALQLQHNFHLVAQQLPSHAQQPSVSDPPQAVASVAHNIGQIHPHLGPLVRQEPGNADLRPVLASLQRNTVPATDGALLDRGISTIDAVVGEPTINCWCEPTRSMGGNDQNCPGLVAGASGSDAMSYPLSFPTGNDFLSAAALVDSGVGVADAVIRGEDSATGDGADGEHGRGDDGMGEIASGAFGEGVGNGAERGETPEAGASRAAALLNTARRPPPRRRVRGTKVKTAEELAAAEHRRLVKNRASATRANARRKEKNDGLKSELAYWRTRKDELEKRQMDLLQERMALKKLM